MSKVVIDTAINLIFTETLILEKMTWWGFEPQTFRFRVGCSNHWATWPCPLEFTNFCKSIRFYCTLVHSLQKAHCWYSNLYPISAELVVPGNEIGGREIKSSLANISTGVPKLTLNLPDFVVLAGYAVRRLTMDSSWRSYLPRSLWTS